MERCETPGRVIDPGPAPGPHPGPVAGGVRGPARCNGTRGPQGTVLGRLLPAPVAVQVFDAGHLGRHVALRRAAVVAAVALAVPRREGIARRIGDAVLRGIAVVDPELCALAAGDRQGAARAFVVGLTAPHRGLAGVVAAVEAIAACALGSKAPLGGGEFELRGVVALTQSHRGRPAVQLQRNVLVVEPKHFEFAARGQTQRGRADAHFGARRCVGGQPVAGGQGPVAVGRDPLARVRAVQPDLAADVGQTTDATGRVDGTAVITLSALSLGWMKRQADAECAAQQHRSSLLKPAQIAQRLQLHGGGLCGSGGLP